MSKIILALPAYNEAENIEPLIEQAVHIFSEAGLQYEIIVVNDGSTDATAQVLEKLAGRFGVRPVTHPKNRGLGGAIKTALNEALSQATADDDIVVNMDADNTHDPAYIPAMTAKIWNENYDVVIASRFRGESAEVGVPFGRRLLSRGARMVFQIMLNLPDVRDYTCGYRAYRVSMLRQAHARFGDAIIERDGFACTDELLVNLSQVTRKITEVPFVLRYDKKRGKSKLQLFKTISETFKMLFKARFGRK